MKATIKRKKIERHPEEVNLFALYSHLWDLATKKSKGKGFKNGAKCAFTEQEIINALADQGIEDHDMEQAIRHCCHRMKILEKKDDNYFATQSGLAGYNARLRRV